MHLSTLALPSFYQIDYLFWNFWFTLMWYNISERNNIINFAKSIGPICCKIAFFSSTSTLKLKLKDHFSVEKINSTKNDTNIIEQRLQIIIWIKKQMSEVVIILRVTENSSFLHIMRFFKIMICLAGCYIEFTNKPFLYWTL